MKRIALAAVAITAALSSLLIVVVSTLPRATEPVTADNATPPAATTAPLRASSMYEVTVAGERPGGGDPAIDFAGGCLVTGSDGSSESKSIEGTTPKTYSYTGQGVSCSYQKKRGSSTLKATARRDGQVVKTVDTSVDYGMVSFAI